MNRSKYVKVPLLVLTFAVIQRSQLGTLAISGIHPDFLLAATVVFGIIEGREMGAVIGFILGLLADSFALIPFGVSSLVYGSIGYLAGMLEISSLPESRVLETVVAASAAGAGVIYLDGVLRILGIHTVLDGRLGPAIAVTALVGTLVSLVAVPLFRWFLRLGLEERPPSRRGVRY